MYGLENIGSQFKGFLDTSISASVNEALVKIPGYAFISQALRKLNARDKGRRLGARADSTTVDQSEIDSSFKKITRELGGSYSPIRIAWNFLRKVFGSTSLERAGAELSNLQSYASLYDSHMFTDEVLNFSLKQLIRRISETEGLLSKLGLRFNKKVMDDPAIKQIKATIKAWFEQAYGHILHGQVPHVGFSKHDFEFVTYIRDQLRSGYGSKYLTDIVNSAEQVLKEAHQVYMERYNKNKLKQKNPNHSPLARGKQARSLAQAT